MKITPLQSSFSSGEVSPLLSGRVESDGYQSGSEKLVNFIPDARGPAIRRRGLKYVTTISGDYGRIIVFIKSESDYYLLILTNLLITILNSDGTIKASHIAPWSESELNEVHYTVTPSGKDIYFTHKSNPVHKLTYAKLADTFAFIAVAFTAPPASWTGSNYPRTGVYFQGRLWLGGTPDAPQTFWASKSVSSITPLPENFTLGALDDDAMQFTVSEEGDIRWLSATKNLLIGTTLGEHIVSSNDGVITPSDIQVTQQSSYGSNYIQPKKIGDQIFYVSPNGLKLRSMQYEWTVENWQSKDITFFSNHITETGIKALAWAQNPDNIVIATLSSGNAAVLTYERGENIFGWGRMEMISGDIKDVHANPANGNHVVAYLVQRVSGSLHVEVFDQDDKVYMDSWATQTYGSKTSLIQNLGHLEGEEVQVVGDGAVQPSEVVVAGEITIKYASLVVSVGKQILSTLKTMPLDKGSRTGSAQPYLKRNSKIFISLLNSGKPFINGIRPPTRNPSTPMGQGELTVSGRTSVANLGWDRDAQIEIIQDLPVPCVITAISAEQEQEIL